MEIKVNGETIVVDAERANIPKVLESIGIQPTMNGIAVALNMEMIPRSLWESTPIAEGDDLEIITARQGG
jgi:sulfur carrier protein